MRKVLVVEDDREIRKLLSDFLSENDFEVSDAADGNAASDLLANNIYDIVLMDMMLPFKSGDVLIGELRDSKDPKKSRTPVIVLSAKTMKDTRLEVLKMGADDYIIKPFDLDEVLVHIQVVLRRSGAGDTKDDNDAGVISHNGITLNPELNSVSCGGENIKLTLKEMKLLELFLKNPTKTFTKANLYETVWEDTYYYEDNTINVHLSNLRAKLKTASGYDFIETVWGIGYRLNEEQK